MSVFSINDRFSQSVRPSRIVASTDFAAGWLAGYLSGNEPSPPRSTALADYGPWERQRDFFHSAQRELPVQRRGRYSVNASLLGSGDRSLDDAVESIAEFFGLLARKSTAWASVTWVPEDAETAEGFAIATTEDLQTVIRRLNTPAAVEPEFGGELVVHLVNSEAIDHVGVIEVAISIEVIDGLPAIASVTVNIERPEDLLSGLSAGGESVSEVALRYILTCAISAMSPDIASASAGSALLASENILASVDEGENSAVGIPGWLTYVSSRAILQVPARFVETGFQIEPYERGMLIEFVGGMSKFGVSEANRLVAMFQPDRGPAAR